MKRYAGTEQVDKIIRKVKEQERTKQPDKVVWQVQWDKIK